MMIFSNITKLITAAWFMYILSAGHCKINNTFALDCRMVMVIQQDINGTRNQRTNSRKISAVTRCPESYKNENIIAECEDLIGRESPFDKDLFRPVINGIANVVYWNKFCAICNNDNETRISRWTWSLFNPRDSPCRNLEMRIQKFNVDDLYEWTEMFNTEGIELLDEFPTRLECLMNGKWPFHLILNFLSCLADNFKIGQNMRLPLCQYADISGRICTKMQLFVEGLYYSWEEGRNGRIDFFDQLSGYNFTRGKYYVETGYRNVYYICEQSVVIYGFEHEHRAKIFITIVSLFFVVFYLGINSNHRNLQNISNKMLYSYMVGLIPISIVLLLIYLSHPVPCVAFHLAEFLWSYHFLWTVLIFIEFCLLAYCTSRNCNANHGSLLTIKFLFHCIFGFFVPLAMPIVYYFGVLVVNKNFKEDVIRMNYPNPCPQIPNHMGVSCVPFHEFGDEYCAYLVDNLLLIFSFIKPAVFLLLSVLILIYIIRNYSIRKKSNTIAHKDHLIVLAKMALIMGIHWILYKIYKSFGGDHHDYSVAILGLSLETICQSCMDFHGVIVFIVFGAGKCKKGSQQEDIEAVEMIESRIELIQLRFRRSSKQ